MIAKTVVKRRIAKKSDPTLVEALNLTVRNAKWENIARILSRPARSQISVNLERIERECAEGDTILVPGKVLGKGHITKKVRICALRFSEDAKEKIKKSKGEILSIKEEIGKNPKMEGIKIIQ